ncbi:unnamed protein product [Heligmosomoides polygyrus]|uniref:CCHC-type domain-containing protein n=1 Tax=Heligmosomoides polygyrus TaxID=6339 RepID=A0A183F4Q4_HELPZ|nr:unnamed protein product [Heligmosomoides polygyrus]
MRCAFCGEIGDHYSDSCYRVRSARQRRNVIEDGEKCVLFLEPCPGGAGCPKYDWRCFHCRSREHHSALCELPEQSKEISENLLNARRSLSSTLDRIRALQEDLRRFDV